MNIGIITKIKKKLDFIKSIGYIITSKPTEPLLSMLNFGGYFFIREWGLYGI